MQTHPHSYANRIANAHDLARQRATELHQAAMADFWSSVSRQLGAGLRACGNAAIRTTRSIRVRLGHPSRLSAGV